MKCIARHCLLLSAILVIILYFAMLYLSHQKQDNRSYLRKSQLRWKKSHNSEQDTSSIVQRFLRDGSEIVRIQRWGDSVGLRKSPRQNPTNISILYSNELVGIREFNDIVTKNGPEYRPILSSTVRISNLHQSITDRISRMNDSKTEDVPKWKRVLFYTNVFGKNPKELWGESVFKECKVPDCVLTDQRSSLLQSDAVIFHGRDMPLQFPTGRYPSQRWIYFNRENPQNTRPAAGKFNGVFNWTMTYKRTSDIWVPYGSYRKINPLDGTASQKVLLSGRHCHRDIELGKKVSYFVIDMDIALGRNISAEKSRLIAWATSHCESTGFLRERYVEQLALKLPIDVFGHCKPNAPTCTRGTQDCQRRLKTYKFYLAFENSLCEDYITEKFWEQAVRHEIVPVVMGGADYKQLVPPKSYIDILDFPSVDKLAQYLRALDSNSSVYNEYFDWKARHEVTQGMPLGWCRLCRMLHDDSLPRKVYWDLGKFWSVKENCLRHAKTILNQV